MVIKKLDEYFPNSVWIYFLYGRGSYENKNYLATGGNFGIELMQLS